MAWLLAALVACGTGRTIAAPHAGPPTASQVIEGLHPVTVRTLDALREPLTVHVLVSQQTHPVLAPLVPEVVDLALRYGRHPGVTAQRLDPIGNDAVVADVSSRFGVRPLPMAVGEAQQERLQAYFHVVLQQGSRHRVVDLMDHVAIRTLPELDVEVAHVELGLTRAIRDLETQLALGELLSGLPEPLSLTAYVSDGLPERHAAARAHLETVLQPLADRHQTVQFTLVDPTADRDLARRLAREHDIEPLRQGVLDEGTFYLHLLAEVGRRAAVLGPDELDLRPSLEEDLRRLVTPMVPGASPGVALVTPDTGYEVLAAYLGDDLRVHRSSIAGGVPDDVGVVVLTEDALEPDERDAMDRFLEQGGAIIALVGGVRVVPEGAELRVVPTDPSVRDLIRGWGVEIGTSVVLEAESASFPVVVTRSLPTGGRVQTMQLLPVPALLHQHAENWNRAAFATLRWSPSVIGWASPLQAAGAQGEVTWLTRSSEQAWLEGSDSALPRSSPDEAPIAPGAPSGPHVLAMTVAGRPGQQGRLVVVGSSLTGTDLAASIGEALGQDFAQLDLVGDLVDWSLTDADLFELARPLD